MQLTQPYNYKYYWQFRGREISQEFETLIAEHNVVERMDRNLRYANRDRFQGIQFPNLNQYFIWRDEVANQANMEPTDG